MRDWEDRVSPCRACDHHYDQHLSVETCDGVCLRDDCECLAFIASRDWNGEAFAAERDGSAQPPHSDTPQSDTALADAVVDYIKRTLWPEGTRG